MLNRGAALCGGLIIATSLGVVAFASHGASEVDSVATRLMIRVVSRDAKIVGSGVGGAHVRVTDAGSGEVLAEGLQKGGTGNTDLIMTKPHSRGMSIFNTEGAAGFVAELQLREPRVVNISARGPMDYPQATQAASKQLLVVPGRHVEGDGIILELHGFIVEILEPEPLTPVQGEFVVRARVRMMCGCPIAPGGMWDADTKEFQARLWSGGVVVAASGLRFAGEPSMFTGTITVPHSRSSSDLELEVLASDPEEENFGRHTISLRSLE